ncbi:MAG: hypothetical protein AAGG81_04780, partial [Chlamydiota bacterium]
IKNNFEELTKKTAEALNKSFDQFIEKNKTPSCYDLWELPAESYPLEYIKKVFSKSEWMKPFLVKDKCGRIPKEVLRDVIIATAARVDKKSVEKYLLKQGIKNPSTKTWLETLNCFRQAPNGQSTLDYFKIPICSKTFEVDNQALNERPYLKPKTSYGECELSVLADIESSKWWQTSEEVHMSETTLYDHLNTLFQNPFEPQLFHTDKYLSFLTVAATALAYLDTCKQQAEMIKEKILPLILLLEEIATNAHKMYPSNYVEIYKGKWLTLIIQLKNAVLNPSYNTSVYYGTLFAHPDQDITSIEKVPEAHLAMRSSEYLSRKVGYWNRYYLTNNTFLNKEGRLKNNKTLDHRIGTLFSLTGFLYEVKEIILHDGFVCQICMPVHLDEKYPIPIKVIYQGTIPNHHSISRDKNPIGPGYGLWKHQGTKLLDKLHSIILNSKSTTSQPLTFAIEFSGHSLGAADAQNAATYFSKMLLHDLKLQSLVDKVSVHTFNPAGIPMSSSDNFYSNMSSMEGKLDKVRHSMVKNDIVEISAQSKLGANFKDMSFVDIMEVSNLGVYHIITNHCLYAHSATDTILPHKILGPDNDAHSIHGYLFGATHSWNDLSGHAHDMINAIPIAAIGFNSLYLVGLVYGLQQIRHIEEAIAIRTTNPILHNGIEKLENSEDSYLKKQKRESIQNIWQGITKKWRGAQILEGTA